LTFSLALVFGCDACWYVHCQRRHDLKEMVLHHIAQAAGRIVEGSSPWTPNRSAIVICTLAT
jgi:hypothetical protein